MSSQVTACKHENSTKLELLYFFGVLNGCTFLALLEQKFEYYM